MSMRTRSRRRLVRTLGYANASGALEIDAQRTGIEAACGRLGLELVRVVTDRRPNGDRAALDDALDRIDAGEAACLVVNELDLLGASVAELAAVLDRIDNCKARLIALDVGLDTATPSGRLAMQPAGRAAVEPVAEPEPVSEPETVAVPEPVAEAEPVVQRIKRSLPALRSA